MRSRPVIRAITLDVGSTLIDPWPSVGHVYAQIAARHGDGQLDPATLTHRFVAAWNQRGAGFDYSQRAWADLVGRTFAGLSPLATNPVFFHQLYGHFAQAEPWRVYPDVAPALAALAARGLRLAVISNWDDRLRPLLEALGLARHFQPIIVSGELGVHKPDPAIFAQALAGLGLPAAAVLHVGDHPEEDIAGATRAGLTAVRIQRAAQTPAPHTITSLEELVRWL